MEICRHLDTGVAEPLAHGDQFDASLQAGRGVVGAQRMEGSMRETNLPRRVLEQPREVLGVDRRTVLTDKDQVRVGPARPGQPLFQLALPTGSQRLHDPGVDTDGAADLSVFGWLSTTL